MELICSDLWGPAPVSSADNFRYYVIFYDHYSKYTWIYFLQHKSEVLSIFQQFRTIVEKHFDRSIKMFQADWGGEFQALTSYLRDNGISQRISCPYTPEQNGCAERKHRHIVETGRALLAHSGVPHKYWTNAFATAVYTINRLPTPNLNHKSPFEILFHVRPNFKSLRVFGCLCYPWLRPYTKNKLEPRSKPCVFLGYSRQHKGYICLDMSSSKFFI